MRDTGMVNHARSTHICITPTLARASIPESTHSHIDLSLKELKSLSRRLAAVSLPFTQELQILERLYYKGKNQHRSALFWKNVVEVRRLGSRVQELDLPGILESLRYSFHGVEACNNSKSLRSPWTHAPSLDVCRKVLKRFRSACCLIDQAQVRFRVAYQTFTVQLRTATFLPLTLSLLAITSRLDFLLGEARSGVSDQWEAVLRVTMAIDSISNLRHERGVQLPALPVTLRSSGERVLNEKSRKRAKLFNKDLEDFGNKVDRGGYATTVQSVNQIGNETPSGRPFIPTVPASNDISSVASAIIMTPPDPFKYPTDDILRTSQPKYIAKGKEKVKVKKMKRDEIDDIFGF